MSTELEHQRPKPKPFYNAKAERKRRPKFYIEMEMTTSNVGR